MKLFLEILAVAAAVTFPIVITAGVMLWMGNSTGWARLAEAFPPKTPAPDARHGLMNL
jgi:hypothetical protein